MSKLNRSQESPERSIAFNLKSVVKDDPPAFRFTDNVCSVMLFHLAVQKSLQVLAPFLWRVDSAIAELNQHRLRFLQMLNLGIIGVQF